MACKVRVTPVRVHWYNDELRANASRIIGYRSACSCGFRSDVRRTWREARAAAVNHAPTVAAGSDGDGGA